MTERRRLAGYGLELPSASMILDSLGRYLEEDEIAVVWSHACRRAGVDMNSATLRTEELLPLVDAIESCGDLAAVCAKGLRIRIMSYLVLSRTPAAATAPLGV